jgi:capsular polysaccharide biosynthesis protein
VNEGEVNHKQLDHTPLDTLSPDDVRERLWAYEDFAVPEEHPPFNVAGAFASLGFIGAAVRRSLRFWLILGAVGMVAGLATFIAYPPSYQANVTVLVKNNPVEDPVSAMLTEVILVESRSVASAAVKALGLTQSVSSFQAAYTASVLTDQALTITANAPTSSGAVDRANEIAAKYLQFRAGMLRAQQALQVAAYAQQVPQAQQQIVALQGQISRLEGQPSRQAELARLQNRLKTATSTLPTLEQTVIGLTATEKSTTSAMIDGTQVLNAATPMHHSKIKDVLEYVLSGLVGGLAIGLGIVIVRELISDRLRRRDDIAAALGAPVRLSVGRLSVGRLSVGRLSKRRLLPGGTSAAGRARDLRRVAAYLRTSVARSSRRPATLAVIAVDNADEIAPAVVILAELCAKEGRRLLVADLVPGAPVAKLLGTTSAGTPKGRSGAAPLIVIIPQEAGLVPSGPLRPAVAGPLAAPPTKAVVAAAKQADLLVTIAELDPAVGGEHLSTWAEAAVAVFTAGRTRAARAYAVGEMLRLSGIHAVSGIVVGSDATDESLGAAPVPDSAVAAASPGSPNGANGGNSADGPDPGNAFL